MNHDPIPLEAIRIINVVKDQHGIPHLEDWSVITRVCLSVAFLEMFSKATLELAFGLANIARLASWTGYLVNNVTSHNSLH